MTKRDLYRDQIKLLADFCTLPRRSRDKVLRELHDVAANFAYERGRLTSPGLVRRTLPAASYAILRGFFGCAKKIY